MKNKGIIITLIILLSIIIFFLIMFLVMCLTGRINYTNGILFFGTKKSNNIIFDKTYSIEDINNIDIRQDSGTVIFRETLENNIQVVVYGENESDVNVNVNQDNLYIDNTHNKKFTFFSFGIIAKDIVVYIPSTYNKTIKIKNDYGNCEMLDLENATVDIDCDCGNVKLGKIKNATVKCDLGNTEIKGILNKCDIKTDCGNVEIDTISIQEDSTIESDLGNVDINKTNDIYIESAVDLGKTNIGQNNRNSEITLKINCDCGNVTVGK